MQYSCRECGRIVEQSNEVLSCNSATCPIRTLMEADMMAEAIQIKTNRAKQRRKGYKFIGIGFVVFILAMIFLATPFWLIVAFGAPVGLLLMFYGVMEWCTSFI